MEVRSDRLSQPTPSLRSPSSTLSWAVRMQVSASLAVMAWWFMPGTGRSSPWASPFSLNHMLTIHTGSSTLPYQETVLLRSSMLIVPVSTEALMVIRGRWLSLLGEARVRLMFRPPLELL